jgi:hypothetical protein
VAGFGIEVWVVLAGAAEVLQDFQDGGVDDDSNFFHAVASCC